MGTAPLHFRLNCKQVKSAIDRGWQPTHDEAEAIHQLCRGVLRDPRTSMNARRHAQSTRDALTPFLLRSGQNFLD